MTDQEYRCLIVLHVNDPDISIERLKCDLGFIFNRRFSDEEIDRAIIKLNISSRNLLKNIMEKE